MKIEEQLEILQKGIAEVVSWNELKRKLLEVKKTGRKLNVKLGLDPTAPDIHLGHTVVLHKAKDLQDLGHNVVIIIGDYTGMIGDPTGKSKTRKQLSEDDIIANAKTYKRQIFKILDEQKTIVRFNSDWLSKLTFEDTIRLTSQMTVARMLERDDFSRRYNDKNPIHIHEFLYPLMQGYDSLAINADVELGGTDQRFNILVGRQLQKNRGLPPQVAIFMPILEGTDGVNKMSKSLDNYIGINESSDDIYGKTMSIPDELIIRYFELTTDAHPKDIQTMSSDLIQNRINPMDLKMRLAKNIVGQFHGSEKAEKAEKEFIEVFRKKNSPEEMKELVVKQGTLQALDFYQMVFDNTELSKSEIRRLVKKQNALKINGAIETLEEDTIVLKENDILKLGRRTFFRIRES